MLFNHEKDKMSEVVGLNFTKLEESVIKKLKNGEDNFTENEQFYMLFVSVFSFGDSSSILVSVGNGSDEALDILDSKTSVALEYIWDNISDDFKYYLIERVQYKILNGVFS